MAGTYHFPGAVPRKKVACLGLKKQNRDSGFTRQVQYKTRSDKINPAYFVTRDIKARNVIGLVYLAQALHKSK